MWAKQQSKFNIAPNNDRLKQAQRKFMRKNKQSYAKCADKLKGGEMVKVTLTYRPA